MIRRRRDSTAVRNEAAALVDVMLTERPWRDQPWTRMALTIAARAIRRGCHLTEAEKLKNLADAMDEADHEHGNGGFRATAEKIRRIVAAEVELRAKIERLQAALKECADELEGLVEAQYPPEARKYPSEARRYERDISPVRRARAVLK